VYVTSNETSVLKAKVASSKRRSFKVPRIKKIGGKKRCILH